MIVERNLCVIVGRNLCVIVGTSVEGGRRGQLVKEQVLGVPSVVTVNPTSGLFCVLY